MSHTAANLGLLCGGPTRISEAHQRLDSTSFSFGFFIFLFFIFIFYKNIFSFSKFTRIYPDRPAAGRPAPGRPAAGRRGFICKYFRKKIAFRSLKDWSPGSGADGPSGRPAAGRPVQASWFLFSEDGKSSCFICLLV